MSHWTDHWTRRGPIDIYLEDYPREMWPRCIKCRKVLRPVAGDHKIKGERAGEFVFGWTHYCRIS
jgi:hypothetical protein